MPFIIYLFSQYGILSSLNRCGINYLITEDRGETGDVVVELAENKFLVLRPETIRERLLVNGLLVNRIKYPIVNLDNPEEIHQHIIDTYGETAPYQNIQNFLINPLFI